MTLSAATGVATLGGDYTIHLVYSPSGSKTDWCIACMPGVTDFRTQAYFPNYLRSEEPAAVTCLMCRSTEAYKQAKKKRNA